WNTPGKGGDSPDNNRRNPWPPRRPSGGGNGLGGGFDRLRDLFGGGNGGGIGRWVLLGVALVVVLTSFTLVGEQQQGVVLRFGQLGSMRLRGQNIKAPRPIAGDIKFSATQLETFRNTVPVLSRDENVDNVAMTVQYRVSDQRLYL